MNVVTHTAVSAKLIGDTTRATMLITLMSGRAMTATELANCANVSPQTASSHLTQLLEGGLLALEKQGRHRYYRLASGEVAMALEALMSITGKQALPKRPLEPIHLARTCYDHVAGHIAVALADNLQDQGWIKANGNNFEVTPFGQAQFSAFGINLELLKKQRRYLARQCLDWTERRHHLAGALGAALLDRMLENKWLRKDKSERVLHITPAGYEGLESVFNVHLQAVT